MRFLRYGATDGNLLYRVLIRKLLHKHNVSCTMMHIPEICCTNNRITFVSQAVNKQFNKKTAE